MTTKRNILVFVDWFWPGYLAGGPVQSIVSLVNYLGEDFNFKIITTNCDLNSHEPYAGIEKNKWIRSSMGCEVFYADPKTLSSETIERIMKETSFDLVYINSFFSKFFSIIPLQILKKHYKDKKVVLAPRGMLGDGALSIKKYKKRAFILYSKLSGLHANVNWHATSEQEKKEIEKVFHPKKPIVIISNLPKKLEFNTSKIKQEGKLKLCFTSRISEKKNLIFALNVLAGITNAEVSYSIYGPLEDEAYWEKCQAIIKTLPQNITVEYKGSVSPKELEKVLATEHVMFLPTLNENFGHSIVESLLSGCPVVISDQTPWNDLEKYNAGYAISLDNKQKFVDAITSYAKQDQKQFSESSQQAIKYISSKIDLEKIKDQYKTLFNDSIKN